MFDETNQTEERELELPENLFGEEELEASDEEMFEAEDASVKEVQTANRESEADGKLQTIKIKYNGEEREISIDEARTLAQKGMNYDHVLNERDTRYKRELDALDKMAAENNMTRSEYVAFVERGTPQNEPQGSPEALIHDSRMRAREQIKRIYDETDKKGAWGNLFSKYPELDRKSARQELRRELISGMSPLEAYQSRLLAQKEQELKIAKNNYDAATRAIGSLAGDAFAAAGDAFLEGFSVDE